MTDSLLSQHDALLVDLDGTVHRGNVAISGAAETLERARADGIKLRFVTNNASRNADDIALSLASFGITVHSAEISSSMHIAARLLADRVLPDALVLVIGTNALAEQVARAGLRTTTVMSGDVVAIVQGFSSETNWEMLAQASLAINAGAFWVVCNVDATFPSERGLLPGTGAMVAALERATGHRPTVVGKPKPQLFIEAASSANSSSPLVIGDRLDTDIAGAVAAGFSSLLVLSGATDPTALLRADLTQRPVYLAESIREVTQPADGLRIGAQSGWHARVDGEQLCVTGDGTADANALLRTLCAAAWQSGVTALVADGSAAETALTELKLTFAR